MEHETKLYSCLFWKGLQLTPPLDYLNLKSLHFRSKHSQVCKGWCRHPVAGWHFGCGTRWHKVAQGGTRWHSVAQCGTRWHKVAGVWISLQLKRLPRWSSTKPCYQPTPYLRQDVRRHEIPWTCWTSAFLLAEGMWYRGRAEIELPFLHTYTPVVPRTCAWNKRTWYNFLLGSCHPHTKAASGFAICMAISRPPWPYKDTAWLTCQGTCAMQMAMRDTKNLTLQEAVKCPVDIWFEVDASVQNNVYWSKRFNHVK